VEPFSEPVTQLTVKWNQSYPTETKENVLLGLNWALANLGAKNVIESANGFSERTHKLVLEINLLGFNETAVNELQKLHSAIKSSEEYQHNQVIDVGRYVTLLIGASAHYNRITQVPIHLRDIISNYNLHQEAGFIDNSGISSNHRTLQFSKQKELNQVFVSTEIDANSGQILEFETIEIMGNGHLRFGIFDQDSNRIDASNSSFSTAGKPAKCMWCHESKILPIFNTQNNHSGYLSYLQLKDSLLNFQNNLEFWQFNLPNGIDFSQKQDHAQMELLYISFMLPSAQNLSTEWGISETEVIDLLKSLPQFVTPEFLFLGKRYAREDVQNYAPFESLKVSSSVREKSDLEVNYID
jgi:hypothetical protein